MMCLLVLFHTLVLFKVAVLLCPKVKRGRLRCVMITFPCKWIGLYR